MSEVTFWDLVELVTGTNPKERGGWPLKLDVLFRIAQEKTMQRSEVYESVSTDDRDLDRLLDSLGRDGYIGVEKGPVTRLDTFYLTTRGMEAHSQINSKL